MAMISVPVVAVIIPASVVTIILVSSVPEQPPYPLAWPGW